jgi:4-amino-4-deoxy-L-arabinose transferase-like glycosyltransferase
MGTYSVSENAVNRRSWLVGLFALLAFAQTLAYYVYLRDDPGNYNGAGAQGDQVAYIDLAQQILHGTWQGAVHYMPGLPAVIALGQLLTGDPRLGIALIQAVLYALMVVFAARLAARAFGEGAGVWAAAGVGLNPALGYYAAQALTEFLTAAVLLALVGAILAWSRQSRLTTVALAGLLIAAAAYLRAEYLGLAIVFALIVVWVGLLSGHRAASRAPVHAAVLVAVTALAMAPWVVRYAVATGRPALYNESPFSNLMLMGTWFRVFDEQTFAQLQQIETAPGPREQAIAQAQTVGPRPDLSQRYMEQSRGPYERPLPETLSLAAENVRLNLRQYLVNHFVLAPVLIWAGHTPVRQADAPRLPASARYLIWGAELVLLLLALWQAVRGLWDQDRFALSISFLSVVLFLTAVHVIIAVDERFTTPALPLVGLFAGARIAQLLGARRRVAVRYAG